MAEHQKNIFKSLRNSGKRSFCIWTSHVSHDTESAHRIHNPFTSEKLTTSGAALSGIGNSCLIRSGSGEMLCTWARDYKITGLGIDMSQLFSAQAKLRAEEPESPTGSRSSTATLPGMSPTKRSVAARIGATWIGGGIVGQAERNREQTSQLCRKKLLKQKIKDKNWTSPRLH